MTDDWGLPDWTDPRAYGATDSWLENRWRWEFTRRREDYRADFDAVCADTFRDYAEYHESRRQAGLTVGRTLEPHEPGFQADTSWEQIANYGTELFNPRISEQPQYTILFRSNDLKAGLVVGTGHFTDFSGRESAKMTVPEGCVGIRIDLDRPIAEQLASYQRMIKWHQKSRHGKTIQRRHHPELWFTYLRVLDGREAGASWAKIFEVVLKETKGANANPAQEARGVWERARDLMFNWPD